MEDAKKKKNAGPLYLYIDEVLYDVTEFINKHPGGSVIRTMLWTIEDPLDATVPFREYHYRSMQYSDKIPKILASFSQAPKELQDEARNELVLNIRKDPRRQRSIDMMNDYCELSKKFKRDGFYDASFIYVSYRVLADLLLFIFSLWLCKHFNWFIGACGCAAVSQNLFWSLVHESGHRSFSGIVWLDKLFQFLCFDLFFWCQCSFLEFST